MTLEAARLLNDDGTASVATVVLMSHHGFRRDIIALDKALRRLGPSEIERAAALQAEWTFYRNALHHHHEAEDTQLFPQLLAQAPELASVVDHLTADHRKLDPLLDRGDRAFEQLPLEPQAAKHVIAEISTLLDDHFAYEEAEAVPRLRGSKELPAPPSDALLEAMADGFAWSSYGVSSAVLEALEVMLPDAVRRKLPAARALFEARHHRAFGDGPAGASLTCAPDFA